MNIAFISDGLGFGGKERQLTEIVKYLHNTKHKAYVYYFKEKKGFLPQIKQYAFKTIKIPKPKKKSFKPFFFLYSSFKENKLHIIHTFDSMSSFYSLFSAKLLRIPLIDGSIRDAGIEKKKDYWFKRLNLNLADGIIANNQAGLKYYKVVDGHTIYNAINLARFKKTTSNNLNIIMVASFSDYKDHNTFLHASKILIEKNIIDNISLVGDGSYFSKYREMVENWHLTDRIIFYGKRNDVENILTQCVIGVLCSTIEYSEGISNSILEYMAAGLIAIGPNIGGIPEIIEDDKNGFLYEPKDLESLINTIKKCIKERERWTSIINNAEETLLKKFSFEKNIKKLLNIYKKIIDEKN